MTVKGGTTPACAVCKYQRRKCSPDCPLSPYFPATQFKTFLNVHRLFGVSNITKTIQRLETKDQKDDAMKSIIYEAEMRKRFPVHGCCVVIAHLHQQLQFATEELRSVYAQLAVFRDQLNKQVGPSIGSNSGNSGSVTFQKQQQQEQMGSSYGISPFLLNGNDDFCDNMFKPLLADAMTNSDLNAIQAQLEVYGFQERNICSQMNFQERDMCTQVICDNSLSSFEDAKKVVERGFRTELKTAAAGFSLTTVN